MIIYYIQFYDDNVLQGIYVGGTTNYQSKIKGEVKALKKNHHSCIELQKAFNQFGIGNMEFIIKEKCTQDTFVQRKAFYCASIIRHKIKLYNTNVPGMKY